MTIGVLTDMNGPFSDQVGRGSVVAAELAAEDFAREDESLAVTIVSADHQNKPDIGLAIARRWIDTENVAAIVDLPHSGVALGVAHLMRERDRVALASSSMTSDLTGKACAPTTVQWVTDTWAQGRGTVAALAGDGLSAWYFLTVDYALGHALERDATAALAATGGSVSGATRQPLGTADFSSSLLRARSSGAQVLALASTGADMIAAIKQAGEFGLTPGLTIAPLFIQLSDIHALGLETAQKLRFVASFYWDLDDATRAWSRRWGERMGGRMPTEDHAGVYSATLAYLRAVRRSGTVEGARVVAAMKAAPIDDPLFGRTIIRADGRAVHDVHVFEVKRPAQSRGPYDYSVRTGTIPGAEAFRPLAAGECPLVRGSNP
ncbi:ABC transporter substrate-binding protein [Enterovirga rhinocerotis]|uniref:ABC transporter substrate-binding protein n=1 Tax=Enterovirga rhinocerotis TaxID=1339210 RepID=UPI00315D2A90